jgi:hypothetical protein
MNACGNPWKEKGKQGKKEREGEGKRGKEIKSKK